MNPRKLTPSDADYLEAIKPMSKPLILIMPGQPRYQPKALETIFGQDNSYLGVGKVEIALLEVCIELGVIPPETGKLLTPEVKDDILAIRATDVDEIERKVTKHDIRAWIIEAKKVVPAKLGQYLHLMLTSYDALDTGRIWQYIHAHQMVIKPACKRLMLIFVGMVRQYAEQIQIGRTHGQHALPITLGFWLSTVLGRLYYNFCEMDRHAEALVGKISGAVGAYNAQVGLGIPQKCRTKSFETRVLEKLGLKPAPISTQILPPEPLAYYLHACCLFSASLAQFGRDFRHLMRTEIAEVSEPFAPGQSGSSTMAHKRNPLNFENIEGMWLRTKNEYGKVLDTLISEHQRDLVGSCVARDFPIILINLMQQMGTLLRENETKQTFLERIVVNPLACQKNFETNQYLVLAEPLYILLQMHGYEGDAHELVNHTLVPWAQEHNESLIDAVHHFAKPMPELGTAWDHIPYEIRKNFSAPKKYIGSAKEKALQMAEMVEMNLLPNKKRG